MTHPDAPAECPHFFQIDGIWYLGPEWAHDRRHWSHDSDWPIKLLDCGEMERHIIASVAAEFWYKKAKSLAGSDIVAYLRAVEKMKEWRVWGHIE